MLDNHRVGRISDVGDDGSVSEGGGVFRSSKAIGIVFGAIV